MLLASLLAWAPHPSSQPCPVVHPVRTPFVVTPSRVLRADADVRINDFPVHMFLAQLLGVGDSPSVFVELHPYITRTGVNRCSVTSPTTEAAPYTVVELDAREEAVKRALTTFAVDHPSDFAWREQLPQWRWLHGRPITNDLATRDSLHAFYEKLHRAIGQAHGLDDELYEDVSQDLREFAVASSVAQGRPFTLWEKFYATSIRRDTIAPQGASLEPLVPRAGTTLHVFANGALAYLAMRPAADAPELPVAIALIDNEGDAYMNILPWFRLGDDGAWHVDGMTKDSRTF